MSVPGVGRGGLLLAGLADDEGTHVQADQRGEGEHLRPRVQPCREQGKVKERQDDGRPERETLDGVEDHPQERLYVDRTDEGTGFRDR